MAARGYVLESIGGVCPTQAEGVWVDGERFYFRARHGWWTLQVGPEDAVEGREIACGEDETRGAMSDAAVIAILDAAAAL